MKDYIINLIIRINYAYIEVVMETNLPQSTIP